VKGQFIWENGAARADEYAEFADRFVWHGGAVRLRISADSNYAAYVNGTLVAFGQYADYPHYKVADTVDVTHALRAGENELTVTVWYYGEPSSVYCPGEAGLFYEITEDGVLTAASGPATRSRPHPRYVSHRCRRITPQLGFGYDYDAGGAETAWHPAVPTGYAPQLHERPILPLTLETPRYGAVIKNENDTHFLLDLGREEVGFLTLDFVSPGRQTLTIAYGEHILDGGVRWRVGGRDFHVGYTAVPGENRFTNHFRRFGARYLEIFCEAPITSLRAGLCPTTYPVTELPFDARGARRQAIYDVCVRTLRLCMHEHYEDCPWREQALYAMDSRNQMLSGYYAFGETRFARACLALMAQDRREDGLLAITYPCGMDLTIPSFSLHYYTEMREYAEHSGDATLARAARPKLLSVLAAFTERLKDGLVPTFAGKNHWNFYEWSDGLSGTLGRGEETRVDLLLNCLLVRALSSMAALDAAGGFTDGPDYSGTAETIRRAIRASFLTEENGAPIFADFADDGGRHKSELGNALAILAGAASPAEAAAIAERLTASENGLVGVTLSMKCFVYDALLAVDRPRYAPWILSDIDRVYGRMLDAGATSVWETEAGAADFDGGGSLCHGWSAMPVTYYHILSEFL